MLLAQSLNTEHSLKGTNPPFHSTPFCHYGSHMVFSPFLEPARPAPTSALVHLFSHLLDPFPHPAPLPPVWNQPKSGTFGEDPADSQKSQPPSPLPLIEDLPTPFLLLMELSLFVILLMTLLDFFFFFCHSHQTVAPWGQAQGFLLIIFQCQQGPWQVAGSCEYLVNKWWYLAWMKLGLLLTLQAVHYSHNCLVVHIENGNCRKTST